MMGLEFNGCFVIDVPFINEGHSYGFIYIMGFWRSNLVGLLVYDGMRTYPGHWPVLYYGSLGIALTLSRIVNILNRPYRR